MKTIIKHFFGLWIQFLIVYLVFLLFKSFLPFQLYGYIDFSLILIVLFWYIKGYKLYKKESFFKLLGLFLVLLIGSALSYFFLNVNRGNEVEKGEIVGKHGIYFQNEGVYYSFENFPKKIGLDLNNDGYIDIFYNENQWEIINAYDFIGWIIVILAIIYLLIFLKKLSKNIQKVAGIQTILLFFILFVPFHFVFGNDNCPSNCDNYYIVDYCDIHTFKNVQLNFCCNGKVLKNVKNYSLKLPLNDPGSYQWCIKANLNKYENRKNRCKNGSKESCLVKNKLKDIIEQLGITENNEFITDESIKKNICIDYRKIFYNQNYFEASKYCNNLIDNKVNEKSNLNNNANNDCDVYVIQYCDIKDNNIYTISHFCDGKEKKEFLKKLNTKNKCIEENLNLLRSYNYICKQTGNCNRKNRLMQLIESMKIDEKMSFIQNIKEKGRLCVLFREIYKNEPHYMAVTNCNKMLADSSKNIGLNGNHNLNNNTNVSKNNTNGSNLIGSLDNNLTGNTSVINNGKNTNLDNLNQTILDKSVQNTLQDLKKLFGKKNLTKDQKKVAEKIKDYSNYIGKVKKVADVVQKGIDGLKEIGFDEDKIKEFENTIKDYKQLKWKRFLVGDNKKINDYLKNNAKKIGVNLKEAKKLGKNYNKKLYGLTKKAQDMEEKFEQAQDKIKKWEKIGPVMNGLEKAGKVVSIFSDASDLQKDAEKSGIKLSNGEAIIASSIQNLGGDILGKNPVDETLTKIGDSLEEYGKLVKSKKIENAGKWIKDKITLAGNLKQTVKFAVATDNKTMIDMFGEYDNMYKEEAKKAGTLGKVWAYTKYKVISRGYWFGVAAVKGAVAGGGKLYSWVKSWF